MNQKPSNSVLSQLQAFYKSLTAKQMVLLLIGGGIVSGVLWLFVNVANAVDYKTLYSNLDPQEAQSMASQLSAKNIPYQLSPDGTTLKVPADQVDKLRVDMAAQGLPQNGRLGFEIFDKPNWSGSDFAEKVNYQRALEGELERTIQSISGVEGARVHITMPRESLFSDQDRKAKAAVVLRFRGRKLGDDSGRAIKFLVASAVDSLSPQDVTIVDAQGRSLLAEEDAGIHHNEEMEKLLSEKLVATLTPIVGLEKVKANVTVSYDLSSSEETKETYDPNSAVAVTKEMSEEKNGAGETGGVPGTSSNVPGKDAQAKEVATDDIDSHSSKTESGTYAVNKTVHHSVMPAGRVERLTAAVLIDDDPKHRRTPEEMKSIEELAKASVGFDEKRGDVLKVESVAFQLPPPEKIEAPPIQTRVQQAVNDWSTLLRYGAVILAFFVVYALVLKPVRKQIMTAFKSLQLPAPATAALAGQGAGAAGMQILAAAEEAPNPNVILKKQLVDKVKKEPESASKLIQSWMAEEKRR